MKTYSFNTKDTYNHKRLDNFLQIKLSGLSRTYIQKLIKNNNVTVNGKFQKKNFILKNNDLIKVNIPKAEELKIEPEEQPLDIIYEDECLLVVNKPKGMVVHPAPGNYTGTLVNALIGNAINLSGINGVVRPGIIHRLDKDTSGLIIVAKNDMAHKSLSNQMANRLISRKYRALVHGSIQVDKGIIDAPIGRNPVDRKKMAVSSKNSKKAVTHFKVIERFSEYTFVELTLDTGRTHQIRVHMAYIKHPIVGDKQYGRKGKQPFESQALHAFELSFNHPKTNNKLNFINKLPDEIENYLEELRAK